MDTFLTEWAKMCSQQDKHYFAPCLTFFPNTTLDEFYIKYGTMCLSSELSTHELTTTASELSKTFGLCFE